MIQKLETFNINFSSVRTEPKNKTIERDVDLDNLIVLNKGKAMKGYFKYVAQQKKKSTTNIRDGFFQSDRKLLNSSAIDQKSPLHILKLDEGKECEYVPEVFSKQIK